MVINERDFTPDEVVRHSYARAEFLAKSTGHYSTWLLNRAEAAEAALQAVMTRAAQLEAERDLANAHAERLMNERDEARRQLEQAQREIAELTKKALAAQLYDEWGGYYILQRLVDGRYQDVRRLTRAEAETIRLRGDEALEIKWGINQ